METSIVKNDNIAIVWATRPLLTGPLLRLSNASIHWKKRTTTTPGTADRKDSVSRGGQMRRT